jgi:hypothetical protein
MIRTNLSTRPFYNVRAVQAAIAALALIVALGTAWNGIEIVRLARSQQTLGAKAEAAEREAVRLRAEASRIRGQIDVKELDVVAKAAREANGIIDQRTFSWTNLFTHLEATLPADVRIKSITPRPAENVVVIGCEARTVEDLDAFVEGLEMTGAFHDVLPVTEVTMENELIEAVIEARYSRPLGRVEPAAPGAKAEEARP